MSSKKIKEIVESTGIPRDRVNELIRKKLISYELIKGSKHLNEKDVNEAIKKNMDTAKRKYKINKSNLTKYNGIEFHYIF